MTHADEIQHELLTHIQEIVGRGCSEDDLDAIEAALAICLASCVLERNMMPGSLEIEEELADGAIEGVYNAMHEIAERN